MTRQRMPSLTHSLLIHSLLHNSQASGNAEERRSQMRKRQEGSVGVEDTHFPLLLSIPSFLPPPFDALCVLSLPPFLQCRVHLKVGDFKLPPPLSLPRIELHEVALTVFTALLQLALPVSFELLPLLRVCASKDLPRRGCLDAHPCGLVQFCASARLLLLLHLINGHATEIDTDVLVEVHVAEIRKSLPLNLAHLLMDYFEIWNARQLEFRHLSQGRDRRLALVPRFGQHRCDCSGGGAGHLIDFLVVAPLRGSVAGHGGRVLPGDGGSLRGLCVCLGGGGPRVCIGFCLRGPRPGSGASRHICCCIGGF
mmetsp:Transcript_173/g.414  ORF Transcript_173/g.414 Transcript_173/m.414 type:complete len:310 (-) Transcript_173:226-1155(-)